MTLPCELSVVETESVLGVNVSFLQDVNIIAAAKIVGEEIFINIVEEKKPDLNVKNTLKDLQEEYGIMVA